MQYNLSIIISHYHIDNQINPLYKTLDSITKQINTEHVEIIVADDGSKYSNDIVKNYSNKIEIKNDVRNFYNLEGESLAAFLKTQNIENKFITKWIYLPKLIPCMSKARIINQSVKLAQSNQLLFLDDDNYLVSNNSIQNLLNLFENYQFIVGQVQNKNGYLRSYNSNRVQGTPSGIKKEIFNAVDGFGEWTEKYSCGVDSDFWIKTFNYFKHNNSLKACYSNQLRTCDSYSKRWKKYTRFLKELRLKYKFYQLYNCKNYKSKKYNHSRNKILWMDNLVNE